MSRRLPSLTLLLIVSVLFFTNHAAPLMPADISRSMSLSRDHLITSPVAVTTGTRNTTHSPENFLGVDCYNLQPSTVSLNECQPLFAKLVARGEVYEERDLANGRWFRHGDDPCVIMLSSSSRRDRRVKISTAHMLSYATEILQTCQESSTGGAYTFVGTWQLVVTRERIKVALGAGSLAED